MNRLTDILQEKLVPIANKFANLSFVSILRNAVMTIVPLMMVGAIGTLMSNLPFESLANILEPTKPFFSALSLVTSSITGLAVVISMGYFASKHFEIDPIFGIITSLSSFLAATLNSDLTINTEAFSASGMFTAIIIGFLSIYIIVLCRKYNIEIRMPEGVPPMVGSAFSVIIALTISVSSVLMLRIGFGFDINLIVSKMFSPLSSGMNTLPGFLLYSIITSILFICGINPGVLAGILVPVLAMNSEINTLAVSSGSQPTGFVTWGMYTIMCSGGTGATIGLLLLMLFSKSATHKTLGKIAFLPGVFHINEPIIYGFPIIFNPIMMIPFILTPIFNITTTWILMKYNIIGRAFVDIPWSTPPIINGFLMSGGNIRTAIWTGLLIVFSVLIYYPFFKIAEKQEIHRSGESD